MTKEVEDAIKSSCRENWSGEIRIDYMPLIQKIAKDPPGFARE